MTLKPAATFIQDFAEAKEDIEIVVSRHWPPNFKDTDAAVWIIPRDRSVHTGSNALVFTRNDAGWTGWKPEELDEGPAFAALKDNTLVMIHAIRLDGLTETMRLVAELDAESPDYGLTPELIKRFRAMPVCERDGILRAFGLLESYLHFEVPNGTSSKSFMAPVRKLLTLDK